MGITIFNNPSRFAWSETEALRPASEVQCAACGKWSSPAMDVPNIYAQLWWANCVIPYGHPICFACFLILSSKEQNRLLVEHWMHIAGVPAEETGARFDNFVHGTPADQIYTLVEGWSRSQGENAKFLALLSSQKGIGKTRLAISAMAEYFVDHAGIHLVMKNGQLAPYVTDKTFIFLKERDLLMKLRASYGNDEDYNEQDIMKELYAVDFLVLDDILANKKSDFDRQILLNILDHRMDAVDKRTVFTSNHNLKDIVSFEDRIGSRLQDVHKGCVLTIETLRIPDYRVIRRGVGGEEERNVICL